MILLQNILTEQTIKFIPTRSGVANELILRNETTNVESQYYYIDCVDESFYKKFSKILTLLEGHFYTFTIYENQKKKEIDNFKNRVLLDGGEFFDESCLYAFIDLFDFNRVLIHRDKVFVTNQDIDTFSVNKDVYVQKADNIIFYE